MYIYKNQPVRLDIRRFVVLFYDGVCVIGKLLKNAIVLVKILPLLYIVKPQNPNFFHWKNTIKNAKLTKWSHAYEGYTNTYNVEVEFF